MNHRIIVLLILTLVSLAGCKRGGAVHQAFSAPAAISPADQDAAEPALAPGPEGGAFVAWLQHGNDQADVIVARVGRTGELVCPPTRVNPTAGMATAWRGDPPSIAVAPDGTLYVAWTARTATPDGKKATDVLLSISHDGGTSFAAPLRVNDDSAPADHGMHSLLASSDGHVYLAWLDGRNPQREIPMPGMDHEKMAPDQKMKHSEGNRELYFSMSADAGKTFGPNQRIAGQVCPCCKTSLAVGPDNHVYVSWRQVLPGSFRHISVASSADAGKTFGPPVIVSDDAWRLAACPVSGAALDAGADGRLRVMWYAAGDAGEAGYYETRSTNNVTAFEPRRMFAAGTGRGTPFFTSVSNGGGIGVWEGGDGAAAGIQFGLLGPNAGDQLALTRIAEGTTPAAVRSEGQIFVAMVTKAGDKRRISLARTTL
jgi:hypothetical protein